MYIHEALGIEIKIIKFSKVTLTLTRPAGEATHKKMVNKDPLHLSTVYLDGD